MARTATGRRAQGPERSRPVLRGPARVPHITRDPLLVQEQADRVTPFPQQSMFITPDADAEAVQARTLASVDASPPRIPLEKADLLDAVQPPVQTDPTERVSLDVVCVEDVDRLWDWYRADAHARALFEQAYTTSLQLHHAIATLEQREQQGQVWIRSVYVQTDDTRTHSGFVVLGPIMAGPIAVFRLYLSPVLRAELATLLPFVLAAIDHDLPYMTLSLIAPDPTTSAVMQQSGFVAHTILTRAPRPREA